MLKLPNYAHPMTLAEVVAEARWCAICARVMRNNGLHTYAAAKEAEVRWLLYAAREYKRGAQMVRDVARQVGA